MAITSLDALIGAARQKITYIKTAARTTVATAPFSIHDLAGNPGAGVLAVGNTANGLVPTDITAGFPLVNIFGGGSTGYLAGVQFTNTVPCSMILYDRLFNAGAYSFNSSVTLTSQPSYAGRVPGGVDFTNTEIWVECVTAFTGSMSIAVTYTNQSGVTGRTTGTVATGVAPTVGRIIQLPLQAGDSGVQQIGSVVASVASAGTFNIVVARRLAILRVGIANGGDIFGLDKIGLPQIFTDSALCLAVMADSTSSGTPWLLLDVANG